MSDEIEAELPANYQPGPDLKQAPAPVVEAAETSEPLVLELPDNFAEIVADYRARWTDGHEDAIRDDERKKVAAEILARIEGFSNYEEDNFWAGMDYARSIAEGRA